MNTVLVIVLAFLAGANFTCLAKDLEGVQCKPQWFWNGAIGLFALLVSILIAISG